LLVAVTASNAVGLLADSLVFLWLAFGSLAFLPGQLVGKAWMTHAAIAVIAAIQRRRTAATA
ncbi:VUT family protein, partial [Streptomyces sp. A73]|nr:VUT family protein [Streptomyces sp. A73]